MKIVVDTNFWLLPGRTRTDVLAELQQAGYTIVLLKPVHSELEKLSLNNSKTAEAARIALQLIKRKGLKTIPSSASYADTAIQLYCEQHKAAAATQDASLRRKLRRLGIPVVTANRSGTIRH